MLDQGIANLMARQDQQRKGRQEQEQRAAALRAMGALSGSGATGGMAGIMGAGSYTGSNQPPAALRAPVGVIGGGQAGIGYGRGAAPTPASAGVAFPPQTGMTGFRALEAQYRLPEGYLDRTAQIESGGNPNAQNPNSSAGGMFQFIDSTARQYGLENRFDPVQAADAAARLARDNAAILRRQLGRDPTAAELYLAHQQGAGGAAKLLANPNARAADIVGADAVRLNGGDMNMTAGQFANQWISKFGGQRGGGAGAPETVQQAQFDPFNDPYVARMAQVLSMPGLSPEERSVVEMQMRSRIAAITPQEPAELPADFRALDLRARAAGYQPGTPEYQDFMRTGGEMTQPGFRRATPEEAAQFGVAMGQFGPDGRFYPINPPSQGITQTITNPDGTTTTIQVGGTGGQQTPGGPTVGQVYNPNEIQSVVQMIDEIAQNPKLPRVVGPIEGGGGNSVDDLNIAQRMYYGGEGLALIERIGQLQSNAWLSARQMLKGGGAITDYESKKAEAAVARLSRAKSEDEFATALRDLRDAITEGEAKLRAANGGAAQPAQVGLPPTPQGMAADEWQQIWEAMDPQDRELFR